VGVLLGQLYPEDKGTIILLKYLNLAFLKSCKKFNKYCIEVYCFIVIYKLDMKTIVFWDRMLCTLVV
jgi:hypothetical protein